MKSVCSPHLQILSSNTEIAEVSSCSCAKSVHHIASYTEVLIYSVIYLQLDRHGEGGEYLNTPSLREHRH